MKAKLAKQIEASNKTFSAASKAEKRVLIAQDVIARIKTGQYTAKNGVYWVPNKKFRDRIDQAYFDDEATGLREVIVSGEAQCSCCALGSLITSCVAKTNNVLLKDSNALDFLDDSLDVARKAGLGKYFTTKQLDLIENAFEGIIGQTKLGLPFYELFDNPK